MIMTLSVELRWVLMMTMGIFDPFIVSSTKKSHQAGIIVSYSQVSAVFYCENCNYCASFLGIMNIKLCDCKIVVILIIMGHRGDQVSV